MAVELEGLEFQIEASGEKAAKGIDALAASMEKLKNVTSNGGGFQKIASVLAKIDNALSGVQNIDKLNNLANALNALGAASNVNIPSSLSRRINQLTRAAGGITPGMVQNINGFASALQNLGAAGNVNIPSVNGAGGRGSAVTTGAGSLVPQDSGVEQSAREAVGETTRLSNAIKETTQSVTASVPKISIWSRAVRTAAHATKEFFVYTAKLPMTIGKRIATSVKQATSSLAGFGRALKRIIMYRALRSMIKAFTQGFSEGLKNLYNYSQMIGSEFAASMDRLATSSLYLKNSLGAMAAPIVNALAPAIEFIIDKIVTLLNLINQLFAKLGGASSYTAAKKVATQWGDAAKAASGSAKKASDDIKRYLLGFDELNILGKKDNGSGSGSGSGGSGTDYSSMFEEREIDSSVSEFANRIKEAFQSQDWTGLGTIIGEKVNEGLDAVPWGDIGKGIGSRLNAAIETSYAFLSTVDFGRLGSGIAETLSNAISGINWNTLGRLAVRKFTAIFDAIIGFVETFDFEVLGTAIHDGLTGIFQEAREWLDSHEWDEFGGKLIKDLKDLLTGLNLGDIVKEAFSTIGTVIRSAGELIGGALGEITITIQDWWDGLPGDNAGEKLLHGLSNIGEWTTNNVVVPFVSALTGIDETEIEYTWNKIGDFIAESIGETIKWFENAGKAVKDYIEAIGEHAVFDNPFADMYKETGTDMGKITIQGVILGAASVLPDIEQWKVDVIPIIEETGEKFSKTGKAAQSAENAVATFFNKTTGYKSDYPALGKLEKVLEDINYYSRNTSTLDLIFKPVKTVREIIGDHVELDIVFRKLMKPFKELLGIEDPMTENVTLQKDPKSKTVAEIFGTVFDVFAKLKGKSDDSKTTQGVFGSAFSTVAKLTGKSNDSKTLAGVFGSWFTTNAYLKGKTSDSKTLTGIFGAAFNVVANLGKGKVQGTSTTASLAGVFGTSFGAAANIRAGVVQGTSKTASLTNLFGNAFTVVANVAKSASGNAAGGIVDSDGNVTRFASGGSTSKHGSLFLAGEAGPEIVGHVGNRSEILNKSQMAQTMYASVVAGISTVVPYLAAIGGKISTEQSISAEQMEAMIASVGDRASMAFYGEESTDKIAEGVREGIYDTIDRQNELLRQQNDLLRQIAEKDTTVEVTASSIVNALALKNQRDGNATVRLNI